MQKISKLSFPRAFGLTVVTDLPTKNTIIIFSKYTDLPSELVTPGLEEIISQKKD